MHHREKARSEPSKYLSVIIDGMDQNKTNVPHVTHAGDQVHSESLAST